MGNAEDLRALNDTLAALAKAGNTAAVNQLWEINQGFINSSVWELCHNKTDYLAQHGLTREDVDNQMYFAVVEAVEQYDATRAGFLGCLKWMIRKHFSLLLRGDHGISFRNKDGKKVTISANPLNVATSLDVPAGRDPDENSTTVLDMIADPEGEKPIEEFADQAETRAIQEGVREAVNQLPEQQREVIERRYLRQDLTARRVVGQEMGLSASRITQVEQLALNRLRANKQLQRLRDETIGAKAYHHTGFGAWASGTGSVEEWAIERQEEDERRRKPAMTEEEAEALRLLRENYSEEQKAQRADLVARLGEGAGAIYDGLLLKAHQSAGGNGGADHS